VRRGSLKAELKAQPWKCPDLPVKISAVLSVLWCVTKKENHMRQPPVSLFALLLVLTVTSAAFAQDTKPAEQKPTTPAATDAEKPKNEVDEAIAEAHKRGETVVGTCIDPTHCGEESAVQVPNLERGRVVQLPKPVYPPIARVAHAQGSVEVQVLIDENGKVVAAAAISGHPLLQAASVKAARESDFTPTKFEGKPVKVAGVLHYDFIAQ
jgi:TonB family protein